jgi:nucleotide-binding universal stress UspA family protein
MLKRILILLGETRSSVCARHHALRLARRKGAKVVGLAGIDIADLDGPMIGGIGTSALQAAFEQEYKAEASQAQLRLHEALELECRDHGLAFEWLSFQGDPIETLCLASETCDLVVAGHDTAFRGQTNEPLSAILTKLLGMTPRPVVVCPDEPPMTDEIMIAYDASLSAMRAVQMFALLGIGESRTVHVVSADASQELAARRAAGAVNYLRSHGFEALPHPIASPLPAAEILAGEVAQRNIGMLVMGAQGHHGFLELLFGSTTSTLVESPPCALFLYH